MATLLHGPRLGAPSASGFAMWARASGAGTFVLSLRPHGSGSFVTVDTQPVDTSRDNTVVLHATGLVAATRYDYSLALDGVQVAADSTWTMPTTGRFVVYYLTDGHDSGEDSLVRVLADFETTYEPLGVPALILQAGDMYENQYTTLRNVLDIAVYPELATWLPTVRRIPMLFMWDDWDFGGNNSARNAIPAFSGEADRYVAAQAVWDIAWREAPTPTPPSRTYSITIAGVPILLLDQRSQRTHRSFLNNPPILDGIVGDEPLSPAISAVGVAHRQWIIDALRAWHDRGLVLMTTGTTFIDSRGVSLTAAARDSWGLGFRAERNYLIRSGWTTATPWDCQRLVVLSGDDHHNALFNRQLGIPSVTNGNSLLAATLALPRNGSSTGIKLWEFKACSSGTPRVFGTLAAVGTGDLYESSSDPQILRWDIVSTHGGRQVTARASFIRAFTGDIGTSLSGPSMGLAGDFYYENGYLARYDTASVEQSQLAPVSTLPGGVTFERGYVDAISGVPDRRRYITRDHLHRLVRTDEIDELDRDELAMLHDARIEGPPRVPGDV